MGAYFKKPPRKGLPSKVQLNKILDQFPNTEIVSQNLGSFEIIMKLKPTGISESYDVKLIYKNKKSIEVYVINRKLDLARGRKSLPHVWSTPDQKLCLYRPSFREWSANMLVINTIIPWALEWLDFYEHWLIDGEWLGGGHDEYAAEKEKSNE
jgi:hypothetical protein